MSGTAAFPFVPMRPAPQQQQAPDGHSRLAAAIAAQPANFGTANANTSQQFAGPLLQMLKDSTSASPKSLMCLKKKMIIPLTKNSVRCR